MTNLIGICGKIGSGKDTVGKIINYLLTGGTTQYESIEGFLESYDDGIDKYPFEIKKYAAKLKQICSILTGTSIENWEDAKFKKALMGREWSMKISHRWQDITYREFLQKVGTEAMRDTIHSNTWVNALFADYNIPERITAGNFELVYNPVLDGERFLPKWIITDVRFPNEVWAIEDREGIIIKVLRDSERQHEFIGGHLSETALDDYEANYVINNNGTMEELVDSVRIILFKIGLIADHDI